MKSKTKFTLILLLVSIFPFVANGTDSSFKIEDFRSYDQYNFLTIEGVTTCESGIIHIRMYEEIDGKKEWIGNASGIIQGFTFQTMTEGLDTPEALYIKYTINQF